MLTRMRRRPETHGAQLRRDEGFELSLQPHFAMAMNRGRATPGPNRPGTRRTPPHAAVPCSTKRLRLWFLWVTWRAYREC